MKANKEQKEKMQKLVVKSLSDDEVKEIISTWKVQRGEKALENFSELTKFGEKIPRPGRIKWDDVSEKYINYIKESDFFDDLNDGLLDEVFFDEELESELLSDMEEEEEFDEIKKYQAVKEDVLKMQKKGLKIDRNLVWDIHAIISGETQKFYLERAGNDIEFLKDLYSEIPPKKVKRIQKRWKSMFE